MSLPGYSARKDEVSVIEEILTSDKYADSEKMAKAVLSAAYDLFQERDWHVAAMRNDGNNLVYGLFGTEGAAIKSLEKNDLGLFGTCGIIPVHSASQRRAYIKANLGATASRVLCVTCGHDAQAHNVRKADPACWGCDKRCPAFIKPEKSR